MNPESLVTEICTESEYEVLMMKESFVSVEPLNPQYYLVNYRANSYAVDDAEWKAPRMSAVHLASAVTACARIHMYPYVSRSDSFYTDTDSIVVGKPLPDEQVSSDSLGKFKLTYKVQKGIFLAPKSYMLELKGKGAILKHKWAAKDYISEEWFQKVFDDPSIKMEMTTVANFRIDYKALRILKKEIHLKLGFPHSEKRENVYDARDKWVGTRPINVVDLGNRDVNQIVAFDQMANNEKASE